MEEFPVLKNDRYLRVVNGQQPVDKSPVWIMRQAGRYLPEFREMRKKHDFFTICQTPSLACAITLQPIDRFEGLFDASIIFSDILVIPQALGMQVLMLPEKGPHFPTPLVSPSDIDNLLDTKVDISKKLSYVYDAISLTRKSLDGRVPLLGFAGAPWTLMAYMIEGGGSKTLTKAKKWLLQFPKDSHRLLDLITTATIEYLVCQVKAGAQALQVFESWAGELSPAHFREFSFPYLRRIAREVKQKCKDENLPFIPMTVFAKGAHYALFELVSETNYDIFSLDWTMDIHVAKEQVRKALAESKRKERVCLQGNMDPAFLFAPAETIKAETERILREFLLEKDEKTLTCDIGYICNLGHGIQPEVPVENVTVFLECVKQVSSILFSSA